MSLSVQFQSFSNLSTGVDYYKKDPTNIKLTQYGEEILEIEFSPNNSIANGNSIIGTVLLQDDQYDLLFSFTGKIVEFTHAESSDKIIIKLVQFNSENWKAFLLKFSQVQTGVNVLIQKIKGH